MPTITSGNDYVMERRSVADDSYQIKSGEDSYDFTIEGESEGYYFQASYMSDRGRQGTIRLNNLTATRDIGFINAQYDFLSLDITGTNSITCTGDYTAISARGAKLSGSGTLSITVKAYPASSFIVNDIIFVF